MRGTPVINPPGASGFQLARGGGSVTVNADGTISIVGATDITGNLFILNGSGLVVGHLAKISAAATVAEMQVLGTAGVDSALLIGRWSANTGEPTLRFYKSRDSTIGSNTAVITGDQLGGVQAFGDDGTDDDTVSSAIVFGTEGTISAGQVPGTIALRVAAAGTLADALTIASDKAVAMLGTLAVTGVTTLTDTLILARSAIQILMGAGVTQLDFDAESGVINANRALRFGRNTDTGSGALSSIWFLGDNSTTTAMELNHKTKALTLSGTLTIAGDIGFYGQGATAKPTGVAVTAAGIHAALVTLNLIAA